MKAWKAIIAGKQVLLPDTFEVINPYTNKPAGRVCRAGPDEIERAIEQAVKGFEKTKKLTSHERSQALLKVVEGLKKRKEEFAKSITLENAKPIKDSRREVARAINTFTIAAEEAKRVGGEYLPVDTMERTGTKRAVVGRFPIGPTVGITPFNFPLNLVAHKIAPALAAGNPIILKPASKTPITALRLGELLLKSGYPKEAISILPSRAEDAQAMVEDERTKLFSFTGNAANGWKLKSVAGKKKVVLELGGNAAVVIDKDADLDRAVERCLIGGFYYSGQNCIHVQRIYCHQSVHEKFVKKFVAGIKQLKLGDPLKPSTDLSVMIEPKHAERIESWIQDAVSAGGKLLHRGKTVKNITPPAVLSRVPKQCDISCEEAFGPVVLVDKVKSFEEGLDEVNDSRFGLQAGVFTKNLNNAWKAFETLEVGGVMVNEIPTFRVDHMPYGGVKDSGLGREGPKYAIEDHTEQKIMIIDLKE